MRILILFDSLEVLKNMMLKEMLVFAFLDEAIAELEDDKLADEVRSLVTKKLELRLE